MRCHATLALLLLGACGRDGGQEASSPLARNVVLVSIDSLRADHLACYGYARETSPTLDALAEAGVLFESVVAESSWTLPTHHTMLTGLSSLAHGVLEDDAALGSGHRTLAEILRDRGFRTHGVWSGPYLHPAFGFGQGYEVWEGVIETASLERGFEPGAGGEASRKAINRANRGSHRSVTSPRVLERAIAFLDDVNAGERFFLFVHFFDVHYDFIPPEEYWRRFDPDYTGSYDGARFITDERILPGLDARLLRHVIARYDGEIRWVDEHLAGLVQALERLGREGDTLLVVTSDHGEEFFEHGGKGHHRTLFDEVLRVPLVMWQGGGALATGHRVTTQVRHLEIAPTLLEALGVEPPAEMQGRSLVPALRGRSGPEGLEAVSHLFDPDGRGGARRSLRIDGAKVVLRRGARGGEERLVFDLEQDPGEQRVLRADTERGRALFRRLSELEQASRRLRDELGVQAEGARAPEEVREMLDGLGYTE